MRITWHSNFRVHKQSFIETQPHPRSVYCLWLLQIYKSSWNWSCHRNRMSHKSQNIYSVALYRRCLPLLLYRIKGEFGRGEGRAHDYRCWLDCFHVCLELIASSFPP